MLGSKQAKLQVYIETKLNNQVATKHSNQVANEGSMVCVCVYIEGLCDAITSIEVL